MSYRRLEKGNKKNSQNKMDTFALAKSNNELLGKIAGLLGQLGETGEKKGKHHRHHRH